MGNPLGEAVIEPSSLVCAVIVLGLKKDGGTSFLFLSRIHIFFTNK
jgi:hypothetical protein